MPKQRGIVSFTSVWPAGIHLGYKREQPSPANESCNGCALKGTRAYANHPFCSLRHEGTKWSMEILQRFGMKRFAPGGRMRDPSNVKSYSLTPQRIIIGRLLDECIRIFGHYGVGNWKLARKKVPCSCNSEVCFKLHGTLQLVHFRHSFQSLRTASAMISVA